jgi:hypothetical protein
MCWTLVALPLSVTCEPSPKSTLTDEITCPVGAVAAIVNVVVDPAVGFADAEIVTVGRGAGDTVMLVDALDVSPNESTAVMTTR